MSGIDLTLKMVLKKPYMQMVYSIFQTEFSTFETIIWILRLVRIQWNKWLKLRNENHTFVFLSVKQGYYLRWNFSFFKEEHLCFNFLKEKKNIVSFFEKSKMNFEYLLKGREEIVFSSRSSVKGFLFLLFWEKRRKLSLPFFKWEELPFIGGEINKLFHI